MSIQAECRTAMNGLAASGAVFTEYDVANQAGSSGWSGKHFDQAVRHAYVVLQGEYKKGNLVRFGPVEYHGSKDYARRAAKIVYAGVDTGPKSLETPNGVFPRLLSKNDLLSGPGRKRGTDRDDTKPWPQRGEVSETLKRDVAKGPPVDPEPLMRRIHQLEQEVAKRSQSPTNAEAPFDAQTLQKLKELLVPEVTEGVKEKMAEALIA